MNSQSCPSISFEISKFYDFGETTEIYADCVWDQKERLIFSAPIPNLNGLPESFLRCRVTVNCETAEQLHEMIRRVLLVKNESELVFHE